MAYSMTGIGEGRITENEYDVSVVIRSVNQRFLNLQIRMPRGYHSYEVSLRDIISKRVSRGKVDVNIDFLSLPANVGEVVVNRGYGADLCRQIKSLAAELDIPDGLTAERLVRFTDMFTSLPSTERDTALEQVLLRALDAALANFLESRHVEGMHLAGEMKQRVISIRAILERLNQKAQLQVQAVRERLAASLQRMGSVPGVDERRMEEEVLIWAVRSDVTEEVTRLDSHINRLLKTLDSDLAVGKELDFIIQELHREITTIGSKSAIAEMNQMVISVKMEIEKLREQVQNLE